MRECRLSRRESCSALTLQLRALACPRTALSDSQMASEMRDRESCCRCVGGSISAVPRVIFRARSDLGSGSDGGGSGGGSYSRLIDAPSQRLSSRVLGFTSRSHGSGSSTELPVQCTLCQPGTLHWWSLHLLTRTHRPSPSKDPKCHACRSTARCIPRRRWHAMVRHTLGQGPLPVSPPTSPPASHSH